MSGGDAVKLTNITLTKIVVLIALIIMLSGCLARTESEQIDETQKSTLRIATLANPDMVIMESLSHHFTEKTGIQLEFIVMDENELRRSVTEDVVVGEGKFDLVTIGTYDTPIWAKNQWIESLEPYFEEMTEDEIIEYNREDLIISLSESLSYEKEQYALPFYGESSMLYYRTDVFEEAGIDMPDTPTWDEILSYAVLLHNPEDGQYGIVLRGRTGWGQNMVVVNTLINSFGGRWFDLQWNPQFDDPEMKEALQFYKKIIRTAGQPEPELYGYLESLQLMKSGKAVMWFDATVAAGSLEGDDSNVKGKIGYIEAPSHLKTNNGWLWAWSLAIESSSLNKNEAFEFMKWATSEEYIKLVGREKGWNHVPSGTRYSTYENEAYIKVSPFSEITLRSIENADFANPSLEDVPYEGIQYLSIPEFQELGEQVSQYVFDYMTDKISIERLLVLCQEASESIAIKAGYKN